MDTEEFWAKKSEVVIVLGSRPMVSLARECIWLTHATTRLMVEREVETGQVERPACLATVEFLCCTEVLQVFVVCPDFDGMACSLKVMPPLLQGTDDREHLGVVDLVVTLHRTEAFGQESHWMPLSVLAGELGEDRTCGHPRAVSLDSEGLFSIRQNKYWGGGHQLF